MEKTQLKDKLYHFLNIGIQKDYSNYNKIRIRILNSLVALVSILLFVIFVREITTLNFLVAGTFLTLSIIGTALLYLNTKQQFLLVSVIINGLYPSILLSLVFIYLSPNNLNFVFLMFVFTSIIVVPKNWGKILLGLLNLTYFLFAQSSHKLVGKMGVEMPLFYNILCILIAVGISTIILLILLSELKRYEDDNQKLITKLATQNNQLSAINTELERFTYVVAHDMKTPLRAINGFINIIERKLSVKDNELKHYFKYVKNGTNQLDSLIVDSLEYAKLGKGEVELKKVNTNELFFDLVRNFISKDIEIYTDEFADIRSNKTLVKKVFQNIIENGLKYNNSEPKTIYISSKIIDNDVVFEIKDNGIGIDKSYHNQIFEMYKQLNTKDKYSGNGLGLAICKKIIQQLKGDIWVESEVGKGSTFHVRLPKA